MDTPPDPLVGPDNDQLVMLVRDEYFKRSSPEEAFETVCSIVAYFRQNPDAMNPDVGALQNVQREPPAEQRAEDIPRNDPVEVEPETNPPRDLKRAEPTSDEPSPQKRRRLDPDAEEPLENAPQLSQEFPTLQDPQESKGEAPKRAEPTSDEPSPQKRRRLEEGTDPDGKKLVEDAPQLSQKLPGPPAPKRPSPEYHSTLDDSAEYDNEEKVVGEVPMDTSNPNSDTTQPPQLSREGDPRETSPSESDERARLDRNEEVDLDEHFSNPEENSEHYDDGDEEFWEELIGDNQKKERTPEKRREESGRATPFTDTDSDDSRIELLNDAEGEMVVAPVDNVDDFNVFNLDVVKEVYRILAVWEFNLVTEEPLALDDISRVLHIRKYTPVKLVNFPIDIFEVTIGYRNIIFDVRHAPTRTFTCVQYLSHTEGCVFQYNDTSVLIKGIKYQSLAAKDFFFMVRHPDAFFQKLAIKITNYETPAIYPFQSFLWKIDNYFNMKPDLQLSVIQFSMTTFYHNTSGDRARNLIYIFWPKLVPAVLNHVTFRVWKDKLVRRRLDLLPARDRNLTKDLYMTQQWQGLEQLDIHDENIVIDPKEYVHFTHLDMIRIYTPRTDHRYRHFKKLVNAFGRMELPNEKNRKCTVVVPDHFGIREAFTLCIRNRKMLDCSKVFWRENKKVFLATLPNNGEMQISDTWRRANEDVKVLIFLLPQKGDTSVQEALKADLERKKKAFDEYNHDFVFKKEWFTGKFLRPH